MRRLALFLVLPALVVPASTRADSPQLTGTVGPGFTIVLRDAGGNAVKHLDPGAYTLVVHDLSAEHNFHLSGPPGGVDVATEVEFVGDKTFAITLKDARYTFGCDPHLALMRGSFTVGAVSAPPLPKLTGVVGPGATISLTPTAVVARTYALTVRDFSAKDNFHLRGPGLDRKTGIGAKQAVTWKVAFRAGKTYTVSSDAHPKLVRRFTVR